MKRRVKISKVKKVRVYKSGGTQMSTSKYPHGGEHGGDEPIYVDNINDPRLKRYLAEMHLFNEAQAYKPFEGIISEEEYKKGQEALESIRRQGDRFDYSWMTDRDKYEKAYGTIWSGYESDQGAHETGILNWPKPSQRVVHRVPDVVLPIKKIERKEPQLIQRENVPVQKPVYEPLRLAYRSQTIIDEEGNRQIVSVPYAAYDHGWELMDAPRVIDKRVKKYGGLFEYPHGGEHGGEDPPKKDDGIIYVDDPEDPRLKEYNIRKRLYDISQQDLAWLKEKGYNESEGKTATAVKAFKDPSKTARQLAEECPGCAGANPNVDLDYLFIKSSPELENGKPVYTGININDPQGITDEEELISKYGIKQVIYPGMRRVIHAPAPSQVYVYRPPVQTRPPERIHHWNPQEYKEGEHKFVEPTPEPPQGHHWNPVWEVDPETGRFIERMPSSRKLESYKFGYGGLFNYPHGGEHEPKTAVVSSEGVVKGQFTRVPFSLDYQQLGPQSATWRTPGPYADSELKSQEQFIRDEFNRAGEVAKPYTLEFKEAVVYPSGKLRDKQNSLITNYQDNFKKLWQYGEHATVGLPKSNRIKDLEAWNKQATSKLKEVDTRVTKVKSDVGKIQKRLGYENPQDVLSAQGLTDFRKLYKDKRISYSEFMDAYNNYLKPYDPNNVTISVEDQKKLENIWRGPVDEKGRRRWMEDPMNVSKVAQGTALAASFGAAGLALAPEIGAGMALLDKPLVAGLSINNMMSPYYTYKTLEVGKEFVQDPSWSKAGEVAWWGVGVPGMWRGTGMQNLWKGAGKTLGINSKSGGDINKFINKMKEEGIISKTIDNKTLIDNPNLLDLSVKRGLKDANTSYRSVFPKDVSKVSEADALNMSKSQWQRQGDDMGEAMYMSTHIPSGTYAGRVGSGRLSNYDTDLLYTGIDKVAAKPNAMYGPYNTKVRPSLDFTEGNAQTWFNKYNPKNRFTTNEATIKSGDIFTDVDAGTWPIFGKRGEQVLEPISTTYSRTGHEVEKEIERFLASKRIGIGDKHAEIMFNSPEVKKYIKQLEGSPFSQYHNTLNTDISLSDKYRSLLNDIRSLEYKNPEGMERIYFSPVRGLKYGGVISSYGWDYKKEGDKYLTKRTGTDSWITAQGPALEAIKQKVFNETPYTDEQRRADYVNMVKGLMTKGYSIDDLVDRGIGTRSGLLSMFGEQEDQPTKPSQDRPTPRKEKDQWGRSPDSKWYGFDPEKKVWTKGDKRFAKPNFSSLFQTYSGAMGELFDSRNTLSQFIQPDISMTDWQSAPSSTPTKSAPEEFKFEQKPEAEIIGKLTKSQQKEQKVFEEKFGVIGKSNLEVLTDVVEAQVNEVRNQLQSRGLNVTEQDLQDVRERSWHYLGARSAGNLGLVTETQDKIKGVKKEPSIFNQIMQKSGEALTAGPDIAKASEEHPIESIRDYWKNSGKYLDYFLTKEGWKTPSGEIVEYKETEQIKEVKPKVNKFYEESESIWDEGNSTYLVNSRNQWDNSEGFTYISTPAKSDKRTNDYNLNNKNEKTFNNVESVGHFILDASPLQGYTYMHGNNFDYIRKAIGKDEYIPVFKTLDKSKVNMTYKRPSEMSKDELKALEIFKDFDKKAKGASESSRNEIAKEYANKVDKNKVKILAPLRQFNYSDIDLKSGGSVRGFKSAKALLTKDGEQTHIIYTDPSREKFGRFDGLTVSFIFSDKYGNRIVRDFTGSVKGLEKEAESIKSTYNLKDKDLVIGYHDVGSFSGKPKAENGNLSINQWDGFNTDHGTGAALIIPKAK